MTNRPSVLRPSRSKDRLDNQITRAGSAIRRYSRTDGRFDVPVVTGRTPQQVARRLA